MDNSLTLALGLAYIPQLDPLPLGQLASASGPQLAAARALQAKREAAMMVRGGAGASFGFNSGGNSAAGSGTMSAKRGSKKSKSGGGNGGSVTHVLAGSDKAARTEADGSFIVLAPGATDVPAEFRHLKNKRIATGDLLRQAPKLRYLRTVDGQQVCLRTWFNGVGTCKDTHCLTSRNHDFPAPGARGGAVGGSGGNVVMPSSTGALPAAPAAN